VKSPNEMATFNPLEDLGKKAQDLVLKKGFPAGIFKVTTETKTDTGVKVITESSSNQKNEILGVLKPEIEFWDNYKFKAELNTNRLNKLQLTVSNLPLEDAKLDLIYTQDPNKSDSPNEFEGKGTYKYQRIAGNVGVVYQIEKNAPKLKGQLVVNYPDNVYWSMADEFYNYSEDEKPQWDVSVDGKISYIQPTFEALGNIVYKKKENKTTCSASWFQGLGSVSYGVIYSTTLNNEGANVLQSSLDVAGENKTNSGAILKGRITTSVKPKTAPAVRSAFSVAQKVSPAFTVTVGADINCRHLFNIPTENSDSLPHSFGFEVKLND